MDEHIIEDEINEFYSAILSLETIDECRRFMEDITTVNELRSMSQRYQVAKLLIEGKTFNEIIDITKASSATISRVNRCIRHGVGGYNIAIERLKDDNE